MLWRVRQITVLVALTIISKDFKPYALCLMLYALSLKP